MKKARIYTRTGFETNDREAVQQEACRKYCKENNFEVQGVSGIFCNYDTPKNLFDEALQKILTEKPDVIVVASVERVARNTADLIDCLKELGNHGIELHSAKDGILRSNELVKPLNFKFDIELPKLIDEECPDHEEELSAGAIKIRRFIDAVNNYLKNVDLAELYESAPLSIRNLHESRSNRCTKHSSSYMVLNL